jgi:hypothetical protein
MIGPDHVAAATTSTAGPIMPGSDPLTLATAPDKRQLIDTLYGGMIRRARVGNDGFAQIGKALGK